MSNVFQEIANVPSESNRTPHEQDGLINRDIFVHNSLKDRYIALVSEELRASNYNRAVKLIELMKEEDKCQGTC